MTLCQHQLRPSQRLCFVGTVGFSLSAPVLRCLFIGTGKESRSISCPQLSPNVNALDDTRRHRQQTDRNRHRLTETDRDRQRQTDRQQIDRQKGSAGVGVGVGVGVWVLVLVWCVVRGVVFFTLVRSVVNMVLMVWRRVVIIMCVLDSAIWETFFVCFVDGLRGGQKDDEEILSETCQSSSEEEKGQHATSQKSKRRLLRSGKS